MKREYETGFADVTLYLGVEDIQTAHYHVAAGSSYSVRIHASGRYWCICARTPQQLRDIADAFREAADAYDKLTAQVIPDGT